MTPQVCALCGGPHDFGSNLSKFCPAYLPIAKQRQAEGRVAKDQATGEKIVRFAEGMAGIGKSMNKTGDKMIL
jgi:hypothetical protein